MLTGAEVTLLFMQKVEKMDFFAANKGIFSTKGLIYLILRNLIGDDGHITSDKVDINPILTRGNIGCNMEIYMS